LKLINKQSHFFVFHFSFSYANSDTICRNLHIILIPSTK
jgi:hypothetical protein